MRTSDILKSGKISHWQEFALLCREHATHLEAARAELMIKHEVEMAQIKQKVSQILHRTLQRVEIVLLRAFFHAVSATWQ